MIVSTSEVYSNIEDTPKYPYIGVYVEGDYRNLKVLFTRKDTGIVISTFEDYVLFPLGHYSAAWNETEFIPFKGSVTLSNS